MRLENIFSNFLVTDSLNIDNDAIYSFCKRMQKGNNIDDDYQYHLSLDEPELFELYDSINKRLPLLNDLFAFKDVIEQKIFNGWINFDTGKNIVKPHNHARQFLTLVYYVYAPKDCGNLVLMNPNDSHTYVVPSTRRERVSKEWNQYNTAVYNIKPETKQLLIFPSWIFHYVVPSNVERISIAFNTRIYAGSYDLSLGM